MLRDDRVREESHPQSAGQLASPALQHLQTSSPLSPVKQVLQEESSLMEGVPHHQFFLEDTVRRINDSMPRSGQALFRQSFW